MNLAKDLKKTLRQVRQWPIRFRQNLYSQFPQILGHQVHGSPVQLYRHDEQFTTALSFNHFVEFFSNVPKLDITVKIEAFDLLGRSLGQRKISLNKKGSFQFLLSDLYEKLDRYGLFSVSMKTENGFIDDLAYLGTFYPQYMTVLIPKDQLSSPQMIHSHKLRQGRILVSRTLRRGSSDIEISQGIQKLQFYFLNSSKSQLNARLDIFSGTDGSNLTEQEIKIPGYGIGLIEINPQQIGGSVYRFEYQFDRNVDHKKPIVFRQFSDQSWSCNHT